MKDLQLKTLFMTYKKFKNYKKFGYLCSVKGKIYRLISNKSKSTCNTAQFNLSFLYLVSCLVSKICTLNPKQKQLKIIQILHERLPDQITQTPYNREIFLQPFITIAFPVLLISCAENTQILKNSD